MVSQSLPTSVADQDRISLWRRKSAMVLYELEMALGEFVRCKKLNTADLYQNVMKLNGY
jgi:hypothetical protein